MAARCVATGVHYSRCHRRRVVLPEGKDVYTIECAKQNAWQYVWGHRTFVVACEFFNLPFFSHVLMAGEIALTRFFTSPVVLAWARMRR
ncbi:hypothetical protein Pla52o_48360 [Novipirellula galeiformis]|uniref:Uncharacterized protein n=1 Tax=Novipirellula galeiformis TaxID=2528004 RepID=A0A5C6C8F4_9BACT|nr:hypothetical protein Pla52o_48360 [Novipirellula galeiformis]